MMRLNPVRAWFGAFVLSASLASCDFGTAPEEQRLVDLLLDFCANDTPVWFAYQNQGVGADWVRVTPNAEGTFAFTATNRTIIALVQLNGADARTEIIYAHNLELENLNGKECLDESGANNVTGTVTGVNPGEVAQVTMNYGSVYLTSAQNSFALGLLPARPLDVIASRVAIEGQSQASNRVIIRRSQSLANNAAMSELNFTVVGTESFVPTTSPVTISGGGGSGNSGFLLSNFFSQQETSHVLAYLDGVPSGASSLTSIPATHLAAGDYHDIAAVLYDDQGNARGAERFFRAPGPQSLVLAGSITQPSITTISATPYRRLRATKTREVGYGGAVSMEYWQISQFAENTVVVTVTRNYDEGGGNWQADIPDFTGITGWQNSWGLQSGGGEIGWTLTMIGGRAEVLFGAAPEDGEGLPFATVSLSVAAADLYRAGRSPTELLPRRVLRGR